MSRFSWAVRPSQRPKPAAFAYSPPPASVTLAPVTTTDLTDADLGLPVDPFAQESAERTIRAAISYRMKQDAAVRHAQTRTSVTVNVPDDALSFGDVAADDLAGISAELRRLAARPQRSA